MEDINVFWAFAALPLIIIVVLAIATIKFFNRIGKLHDENINQILCYRMNWELWEMMLMDKEIRILMGKIDTFSGTDEEALQIADSQVFISYITLLEKLLEKSINVNQQNEFVCITLTISIHRIPVFAQAVYDKKEKYPLLAEMVSHYDFKI